MYITEIKQFTHTIKTTCKMISARDVKNSIFACRVTQKV